MRKKSSGKDSWDRTDEVLLLMLDSSTIFLLTAARKKPSQIQNECKILLLLLLFLGW